MADEGDNAARESKLLDDAFDRALHWFPNLLNGTDRASYRTLQRLKRGLRETFGNILEGDSSLYKRINGPTLFLKLGMDKKVVENRFSALIAIEEELQIVGKSSFVDTIHLLINYIEVKNPFGQVNNEIEKMGNSFSHICVRMEKGKLGEAVKLVESQLEGKGWRNLFVHGTKAAVAMKTVQNRKTFRSSEGTHDFGPGLYCFRNDLPAPLTRNDLLAPLRFGSERCLHGPLSFAADRCFCSIENPCIFAFPEPRDDIDNRTIDVNHTVIEQAQLRKLLEDDDRYNELENE